MKSQQICMTIYLGKNMQKSQDIQLKYKETRHSKKGKTLNQPFRSLDQQYVVYIASTILNS